MTTVLAIESSGGPCSVALNRNGRVSQLLEMEPREHAKKILVMIDRLLAENECGLTDIDAIAYARGPGSFTGLRIGFGVVQGLAFALGTPVIGISTLRAMAYKFALCSPDIEGSVAVALDARMGELYWGVYSICGNSAPQALVADCAASISAIPFPSDHSLIAAVGEGVSLIDAWNIAPAERYPDFFLDAGSLATLALELYGGDDTQEILDAELAYIRNEVSWKKRVKLRN